MTPLHPASSSLRSRRPWRVLLAPLAALAFAAPAAATTTAEQSVEACAGAKLQAAGRLCRSLLDRSAQGLWGGPRWLPARAADRDERRLARSFAATEAVPLEWGGSCAESTGTADDVTALLGDASDALAAGFPDASVRDRIRSDLQLRALGRLCDAWLDAEAQHLEHRSYDRLRTWLDADRDAAERRLDGFWRLLEWVFGPGPDRDAIVAALADRVHAVVQTVATSPQVSPDWQMIEPPAAVEYRGRTLEPTCWDGAPYVFFAKRGTVNKLVVYYQGGGACWSGATCGGVPGIASPTFKRTAGPNDNPANYHSGFADASNPLNPFADWDQVFVPYCTGDVHWGDAVVDYDLNGRITTVRHKGFVNAQVVERWALLHFVHPDQVFVTGSSAGAYGAIVNSLYHQEHAWPSADFAVIGDAGNGVITQDFLANDLSNWGIQNNLPPWMPGLNVPLDQLRASDLYIEAARTYPQHRFATYTTAYDGGTGGQTGFFQVMRAGPNILNWIRWWDSSCLWNQEMLALDAEAAAAAPQNFRYYVGTGSAHTMWGRDKVYDDTTGGVPTVRDWLVSMLAGDAGWTNVQAADFGVLLPGDPRPNPANPLERPPYTPFDLAAGRVVCN